MEVNSRKQERKDLKAGVEGDQHSVFQDNFLPTTTSPAPIARADSCHDLLVL